MLTVLRMLAQVGGAYLDVAWPPRYQRRAASVAAVGPAEVSAVPPAPSAGHLDGESMPTVFNVVTLLSRTLAGHVDESTKVAALRDFCAGMKGLLPDTHEPL